MNDNEWDYTNEWINWNFIDDEEQAIFKALRPIINDSIGRVIEATLKEHSRIEMWWNENEDMTGTVSVVYFFHDEAAFEIHAPEVDLFEMLTEPSIIDEPHSKAALIQTLEAAIVKLKQSS